jgi:hypothetical protein
MSILPLRAFHWVACSILYSIHDVHRLAFAQVLQPLLDSALLGEVPAAIAPNGGAIANPSS